MVYYVVYLLSLVIFTSTSNLFLNLIKPSSFFDFTCESVSSFRYVDSNLTKFRLGKLSLRGFPRGRFLRCSKKRYTLV